MGDEDLTWLFDAVLGFLKSPGWALPVMSFIDDNCVVFDSGMTQTSPDSAPSPSPPTPPTSIARGDEPH